MLESSALVVSALMALIGPWLPLVGWVVYWGLCVDWRKFQPMLQSGGWIALVSIAFLAAAVWSLLVPTESGRHLLFGLSVGNLTGKLVYTSGLVCLIYGCGAAQFTLHGDVGEAAQDAASGG
jgi:hypothetical protein